MTVTAGFNESIVGHDVAAFEKDILMTLVIFSVLALILVRAARKWWDSQRR